MPPKPIQTLKRVHHNAQQLVRHPELLAGVLRSLTGAFKGRSVANVDLAGSLALQENTSAYVIDEGVLDLEEGAGQNTASRSFVRVDTEGEAPTDELDTIDGGRDGQLLILTLHQSDRVVTVMDSTGNISLGADLEMDTTERFLLLVYSEAKAKWLSQFTVAPPL